MGASRGDAIYPVSDDRTGVLMIRRTLVLAVFLAIPIGAVAEDLPWAIRSCVVDVEKQAHCTTACVNKTWPDIVTCANARLSRPFDAGVLARCVQKVGTARGIRAPELRGDPVREAFECAAE